MCEYGVISNVIISYLLTYFYFKCLSCVVSCTGKECMYLGIYSVVLRYVRTVQPFVLIEAMYSILNNT